MDMLHYLSTLGVFSLIGGLALFLIKREFKKHDKERARERREQAQKEAENQATKSALLALLWSQILNDYYRCCEMKYCPIPSMDNINAMYAAYHALGGNGTVTRMVQEINEMQHTKSE